MELPEHYFPVRVCPHIGEGECYRLMFAECGSYGNVDLSINDEEESITFWPQKGQGCVKNLTMNIPSLPLFNCPLNGEWKEWDHILGMKNFNEMLNDLKYVAHGLPFKRNSIKSIRLKSEANNFLAFKQLIQDHNRNGSHDLTQIPELMRKLDRGLHVIYTKYEKITDAYSNSASSLKGYNRDFYGGLLAVVKADNDTSADVLVHAGGASFQDISLTDASNGCGGRLRSAKLLDKLSLDEPVFQLISSTLCTDEGLVCARQKHKCLLMSTNDPHPKLVQKNYIEFPEEVLTSTSFSPYLKNELLVSTNNGSIYLWDVTSSTKNLLLVKPQDSSCQDKWSCSYFGGHPRHVVVADTTSVAMFDYRSHFSDGMQLFSLLPSLTKKEERVMAVTSLGFPYHTVVTDYAVFVIDQRFGLAPVLHWSTEFMSGPQYIQVLQQQSCQAEQEKILFVASQQPPEVMCFPVNISSGCTATSPVLPWKISQIGDFYQSMHTSYACDLNKVEKRFETSLAGLAVSHQSTPDGFTVYQVDGYGDVFYQSLIHKHGEDLYDLQSCTEEEKQAADKQAEHWLKAFDSGTLLEESQLHCSLVNLAPNIVKDIFSVSCTKIKKEECTTIARENEPESHASLGPLHKNLKELSKLPCQGSSSRLHLALRENKDIKELLLKREDDHTEMKKKMRKKNVKVLKKPARYFKMKSKRKNISNPVCETDSTTDDDEAKCRQTVATETIRSNQQSGHL